ncbi:unnamed protein product [Boreogadus saida]
MSMYSSNVVSSEPKQNMLYFRGLPGPAVVSDSSLQSRQEASTSVLAPSETLIAFNEALVALLPSFPPPSSHLVRSEESEWN